jgi:hypothetical protein
MWHKNAWHGSALKLTPLPIEIGNNTGQPLLKCATLSRVENPDLHYFRMLRLDPDPQWKEKQDPDPH